tara:strand:- start:190 stop:447 length:258 start_codon:yes stop_codon:yes gene_type:complete
MLKKIFYGIYTFSLKKGVDFLLNKTTVDEKIVEIAKETGRRLDNMKEEIKDVGKAAKETINQLDDIVDAAKGEERKGRKPKKNKK